MKVSHLLLGILVMAIWGANYSIISLGLESLDPFLLTGLRFLCCAVPCIFFIKKPDVPWKVVITYGVIFGVGLWGMVNLGMYWDVPAGIASLLLQLSAFFTMIWGAFFFQERLAKTQMIGMMIALLGLFFIIVATPGKSSLGAMSLVLLGALAWSLCNVLIKRYKPGNLISFIVWSSLFASVPLFIISYVIYGGASFVELTEHLRGAAVFSILFQSYVTTILGYSVWSALLKKYPVSRIAPLSLLVPVFGLLTAFLMFHETLSLAKWGGVALMILGLAVFFFWKRASRSGA